MVFHLEQASVCVSCWRISNVLRMIVASNENKKIWFHLLRSDCQCQVWIWTQRSGGGGTRKRRRRRWSTESILDQDRTSSKISIEKGSDIEIEARVEEGAIPGRMGDAGVAEIPSGAVVPHHGQISLHPTAEHLAVIYTVLGTVIGCAGAVEILDDGR